MSKNDLNPCIVKFVIDKYYHDYMHEHWDDLFSYGLEALYRADKIYDPTKTTKNFKYFATCIIRRALFGFIRDKITKTYQNTTYTDKTGFLEECMVTYVPRVENFDLRKAVKKLPEEYKRLIVYVYFKGYKVKEYADKFGIRYHTATGQRLKAIKLLKEILQYDKL